jgi:hypothetical protein
MAKQTNLKLSGCLLISLIVAGNSASANDACGKLIASALAATIEDAKQGHEVTLVSQQISTAGGGLKILNQRIDVIARIAPDRVSTRHFPSIGEGGIPFIGIADEERQIGRNHWTWKYTAGWLKQPDRQNPELTTQWASQIFSALPKERAATCTPLALPGNPAKFMQVKFAASAQSPEENESALIDVTTNRILSRTTEAKGGAADLLLITTVGLRLDPTLRVEAPRLSK